jgi:hypothetical protein
MVPNNALLYQTMAWSAQKKALSGSAGRGSSPYLYDSEHATELRWKPMRTGWPQPRDGLGPLPSESLTTGWGLGSGTKWDGSPWGCSQWRDHCQLMSPEPEVTVSRLRNAGHHPRAGAAQEHQTSKLVVQCFQAALDDWSATHRIAFGRIHQADTIRTRPPFCLLLTVCFTVACFLCWARQGQILQNTSPAAFVLGSATCAHLPSTERGRTSGPQIRKAEPTTHRATNKSTIVSLVIPT